MDATQQIILTFGGAIFFGILFIVISNKLKIPSIVILLLGGFSIGPHGIGLIDPSSLGVGLKAIIQLAVALILFEGGLTLNVKEYRTVSSEIKNALSIGVIITWLMSAIAIKYIFDFTWAFSILAGSLIIVTGPTVVGPLLKRIGVKKNIHGFLHWEGILIDPIGVFIALLCYEWIVGENALPLFMFRLLVGLSIGMVSGFLLSFVIKKKYLSDEILNIFVLSAALVIFIVSDLIIAESGLMSVVIAGGVIGYSDTPQIDSIKNYKAQLIELLIGLLFILLAANLDVKSFKDHYGFEMIIVIAIVMFVIRPVNIFISTFRGDNFTFKEKLFLSWISPRGIVAASMASLFALNLKESGHGNHASYSDFLEAFTYSVILSTVVIQGFSAKWIGKLLKALEPMPTGWLIIGAHNLAIAVGKFIQKKGLDVVFIDTNIHSVKVASREGMPAIAMDIFNINISEYTELYGIGNVLAVTKNQNLNELACQKLSRELNNANLYQWRPYSSEDEDDIGSTVTGKIVWQNLPIDKSISITEGNHLITKNFISDDGCPKYPENVVLYTEKNKIIPYFPEEYGSECSCLIYSPFQSKLDFNIKPEWILFSEAETLTDVMNELLQCLKGENNNIDIEHLHSELIAQEKKYTSYIGHNVSLPHTYIDEIKDSIVLVAKLKKTILSDVDSAEIKFVFMVLSPKGEPGLHIKTLSKISKFIINEDNQESLYKAKSKEELLTVFIHEENI